MLSIQAERAAFHTVVTSTEKEVISLIVLAKMLEHELECSAK